MWIRAMLLAFFAWKDGIGRENPQMKVGMGEIFHNGGDSVKAYHNDNDMSREKAWVEACAKHSQELILWKHTTKMTRQKDIFVN